MFGNISKGRGRIAAAVLFCLAAVLALFYFTICSKECVPSPPEKASQPAKKPKKPKPSAYYCIDRHSVYYKQKKRYKGDIEKLKAHYIKKHDDKYDLAWEEREGAWYLDTSTWSFNFLQGGKKKRVNPQWSRRPCNINKNKTQVRCPVVSFKGILWKLRFSQFEGGFIKIELYRVPLTKEAKQKRQMAKFFGVKERNDIDICLRVGSSPIREILSSPSSVSEDD